MAWCPDLTIDRSCQLPRFSSQRPGALAVQAIREGARPARRAIHKAGLIEAHHSPTHPHRSRPESMPNQSLGAGATAQPNGCIRRRLGCRLSARPKTHRCRRRTTGRHRRQCPYCPGAGKALGRGEQQESGRRPAGCRRPGCRGTRSFRQPYRFDFDALVGTSEDKLPTKRFL